MRTRVLQLLLRHKLSMSKTVILLSGGLDSATTLAIANDNKQKLFALSFDYGQKHSRELRAAKKIAEYYGAKHITLKIQFPWKGSALLDPNVKIPEKRSLKKMNQKIPATYVPARNTLFLSYALSWAETIRAESIYIGANALDYSGYPDCRPGFLKAIERAFTLGSKKGVEGAKIKIKAPLLKKTKAGIVRLGKKLKVPYGLTWSCYKGGKRPCGKCDSCLLRAKGFKKARVKDPLVIDE